MEDGNVTLLTIRVNRHRERSPYVQMGSHQGTPTLAKAVHMMQFIVLVSFYGCKGGVYVKWNITEEKMHPARD